MKERPLIADCIVKLQGVQGNIGQIGVTGDKGPTVNI
jgi:hypothetical protein